MSRLSKLSAYARIYIRMLVLLVVRRPYKLTLLVSNHCNLRCRICSIWRNPQTQLSLEDVIRIWSAFPIKPCWINLSGGEPMLNGELEAILSFFLEMSRPLLITLTTNGYRDCSGLVESVLARNKASLIYVSVSLDGEQAEHDAARGRSDSFARATRTYSALRSLQPKFPALKVGISTTISAVNYRSVLPFIQKVLQDNPAISINLAQTSDYYQNHDADSFEALPTTELVDLLKAIQGLLPKWSLDTFLKVAFLDTAIRALEKRPAPIPCSSVVSNVLITSTLDLVNCTLLFEPWSSPKAPRAAKLEAIERAVQHPRERIRTLRSRIRRSGCERRCHSPCETYVHTIGALLHPLHAPRLVWRYIRVCFRARRAAGFAPMRTFERAPVADRSLPVSRSSTP